MTVGANRCRPRESTRERRVLYVRHPVHWQQSVTDATAVQRRTVRAGFRP
jgi:hypothetical protein